MMGIEEVLRKRFMQAGLWQGLFVASVIGGFVAVHLNTLAMMHPIRWVALNSKDTVYLTMGGTWEDMKQVHLDYAKMAAETLFDRSPDGLDNPERLDRLFNTRTEQQVKDDLSKDSDVFRTSQIHQKIEVGPVREIKLDPNGAVMEVSGQLIRTGFLNQRVPTTQPVVVNFKMIPNDDIEANHKFPLVVFAYEVFWK